MLKYLGQAESGAAMTTGDRYAYAESRYFGST
jgi:hypothetical protein